MRIDIGFDDHPTGSLATNPDGTLRIIADNDQQHGELERLVQHYAEFLVVHRDVAEDDVTPEMILKTIAERLTGRNWAKVMEP